MTFLMRIVFALLMLVGPLRAEDQVAEMATILPLLEKNAELRRLHEACPADIYRSKASLFSLFVNTDEPDRETCVSDLMLCQDSCINGKNGEACFNLALELQSHSASVSDRHYEPLFALACAIGKPAGCTNRGGGIRNGDYLNDPSGKWSQETRDICLRRSFQTACAAEDAWGCAMYGQSLYIGEGGLADLNGAKIGFEKACTLDPDFASCDFAKSYLNDMQALDAPQ